MRWQNCLKKKTEKSRKRHLRDRDENILESEKINFGYYCQYYRSRIKKK